MGIKNLKCFKCNINMTRKEMINDIYKNINHKFIFKFMKKIYKISNDSFSYNIKQLNDILIDFYYNEGNCQIYFVDSLPKKISLTTEHAVQTLRNTTKSKKFKPHNIIIGKEFDIFYKIFHLLFMDILELKNEEILS